MNSNIIFQTNNELERVHLLVIKLEHPIFGFEPNRVFTRFTKLLIEVTRASFFFEHRTNSNMFHLLVIELKHPIFGFEWSNIKLWTLLDPLLLCHQKRKCHTSLPTSHQKICELITRLCCYSTYKLRPRFFPEGGNFQVLLKSFTFGRQRYS